jgi:hypothetical protein
LVTARPTEADLESVAYAEDIVNVPDRFWEVPPLALDEPEEHR